VSRAKKENRYEMTRTSSHVEASLVTVPVRILIVVMRHYDQEHRQSSSIE